MTRGIIFDLYNTLIITTNRINPYINFFESLGLTKEEMTIWRRIVMTENFSSFEELAKAIRPNMNIYTEKYEYEIMEEVKSTHLFDDTEFVLSQLSKKYELFLLSNISTPYKKCFYDLNLDKWISDPFFSCDLGYRKPEKELFNIVIEKSGIDPKNLLMIGDSKISDYEGALNAGIPAILKDKPLSIIMTNLIN